LKIHVQIFSKKIYVNDLKNFSLNPFEI